MATEDADRPKINSGQVTQEYGVPFDLPFGLGYSLPNEIPNMAEISISQLTRMLQTDGQVRALARLITLPVRAAVRDMSIEPPAEGGAEEETEFIRNVFTIPCNVGGMSHSFEFFIAQTLMAIVEGFRAFEVIWKVPDSGGPLDGKIVIEKFASRPSDSLTFMVNPKNGEFKAVRQIINWMGEQREE